MSFLLTTIILIGMLLLNGVDSQYRNTYSAESPYSFSFSVLEPYSELDFGHSESREKDSVTGKYHVLLPDDRLQIVRYQADANGYVADVQYEGPINPSYGSNYKSGSQSAHIKPVSHFYQPSSANQYDGISPAKKYDGYQNKYQPDINHGYYTGPVYQKAEYETLDNYERYHDSAYGKYKPGQQGCTCP